MRVWGDNQDAGSSAADALQGMAVRHESGVVVIRIVAGTVQDYHVCRDSAAWRTITGVLARLARAMVRRPVL